jgi:hypothetical protein
LLVVSAPRRPLVCAIVQQVVVISSVRTIEGSYEEKSLFHCWKFAEVATRIARTSSSNGDVAFIPKKIMDQLIFIATLFQAKKI